MYLLYIVILYLKNHNFLGGWVFFGRQILWEKNTGSVGEKNLLILQGESAEIILGPKSSVEKSLLSNILHLDY